MAGVDAKSQEYFARWPEGQADFTTVTYAATVAIEARNSKNLFNFGTITGAMTVNLESTITLQPQAVTKNIERYYGDEIVIIVTDDGSGRVITWGTGFDATVANTTLVASKTNVITFVYMGSTVGYTMKSNQQID